MTSNYHTPIPSSPNQEATAALFNSRLSSLDTHLGDAIQVGQWNGAELAAARVPYNSLAEKLSQITGGYAGGNIATLTNGAADAGQKVVTVDSTAGFLPNAYAAYFLVSGVDEYNQIASVDSPTQLTLTTNIGATGIANNTYIGMIPVDQYAAANVIPHAGTLTLAQAMAYANGRVFHIEAYGASPGASAAVNVLAINAAINAAVAAGGGVVEAGPGTFLLDGPLEIVDANNITLQGAGIGTTIFDSSATVDIADPVLSTYNTFGIITIDSTSAVASKNITLRDFTLKVSKSMNVPATQKACYFGPVVNFLAERIQIDGGANESLYHDGHHGATLTSGIAIRYCEFTAYYMLGFNTNAFTNGVEVSSCWFHDSLTGTHAVYGVVAGGGINVLGTNISITGNRFESLLNHGILIATEGDGVTWAQNVTISNNRFDGMGNVDVAFMFVIYAAVTGAYSDAGLLIANNVIGPIASSGSASVYGIYAMGPWTITGNVLSGINGGAFNSDGAIVIAKDAYSGTAFVVCTNNTIEAETSSDKWSSGISIENSVKVSALVANNLVRAGSIRSDSGGGVAYSDARGASIMAGNVFNAQFTIAGTYYNTANEYDGLGVTLGKNQRMIGPGYRQVVDGWYKDDLANGLTAEPLLRSAGAATNGFVAIRAGYLTGVEAKLSEGSGGGTCSVEVFKNGSATGLVASVGPATSHKATTQVPGTDSFAEGDVLDVRVTTIGWSTTSADIYAAIEIET